MNAINKTNRKDDIQKEHDEIDDMDRSHIDDEYKDLIDKILV